MAYDTKELEKMALKVIQEDSDVIYIEEVVAKMPCDKATFYRHKCHECNDIKEALNQNRLSIKQKLRSKWKKSDNATLNIAVYKLAATQDELDRLNSSKQKIEHSGEVNINVTGMEIVDE